ncbi:MAG: hypothetical protein AB1758_04310, partial [Candidatus Eremiobacterota bacterium]
MPAVPAAPGRLAGALMADSPSEAELMLGLGHGGGQPHCLSGFELPRHPAVARLEERVVRAAVRVGALWGDQAALRMLDLQAQGSGCLRRLVQLRWLWLDEFLADYRRVSAGQQPGGFRPGFGRWRDLLSERATPREVLAEWMEPLEPVLGDLENVDLDQLPALVERWAARNTKPVWPTGALAWYLALPSATRVPVASPCHLCGWADLLRGAPWERVEPHLETLSTVFPAEEAAALLRSSLGATAVAEALRLRVPGVERLARRPARVGACL